MPINFITLKDNEEEAKTKRKRLKMKIFENYLAINWPKKRSFYKKLIKCCQEKLGKGREGREEMK